MLALTQLGPIPAAATGAGGHLDVAAATQAYLDTMPAADRARSNAYFEGGYWLVLWDFVIGALIYYLFLQSGLSKRLRDFAERKTRVKALQILIYWCGFSLFTGVLGAPLAIHEGYFREHQYGLSNLTFGGFVEEQLKGAAIGLVVGGLALIGLYAIVRKVGQRWWIWGSVTAIAFAAIGSMLFPVFIVPVFNSPKKLEDPQVTQPILSLARANGIDAQDVWEVDASKQSKRVSAYVAGFAGTQRITLNDNLLARASLPEVEAVMGHEMGHYVMNHIYKGLLAIGVLIALGFALLNHFFGKFSQRFGIRDISDPAGLPLAMLLISAYFFILTPITNSLTRTQEIEADQFGLNAARQPDGQSQIALKLAEYRKLDPGPIEEFIFFDHPSGRARIHAAMRWKAEHLTTP